jgi:hypothetical protein
MKIGDMIPFIVYEWRVLDNRIGWTIIITKIKSKTGELT